MGLYKNYLTLFWAFIITPLPSTTFHTILTFWLNPPSPLLTRHNLRLAEIVGKSYFFLPFCKSYQWNIIYNAWGVFSQASSYPPNLCVSHTIGWPPPFGVWAHICTASYLKDKDWPLLMFVFDEEKNRIIYLNWFEYVLGLSYWYVYLEHRQLLNTNISIFCKCTGKGKHFLL